MPRRVDEPPTETGATALLVLGAAGAVVGAILPWKVTFYLGGPVAGGPPAQTGVAVGWGLATAGFALAALAVRRRREWRSAAPLVFLAGALVLAVTAAAIRPFSGAGLDGVGVTLTALAGMTVALAGAVGRVATRGRDLPEPLGGLPVPRRGLGALAAAGGLLGVAFVLTDAAVTGGLVHYDAASWFGLGFLAALAVVGGGPAWSRPTGLVAAGWGAAGLEAAVAGATAGTAPWWA
ncbi:MAG: hypothetical protein ABEJ42_09285, partial [Halobacteriaceae archaeon]